MVMRRGCDPKVLREEEYLDDSHLDVRYRTHQLYTLDPVDFGRWTLERLPWQGDERVLDAGCGPGDLLGEMAGLHGGWGVLIGFDFSAGMVARAMERCEGLGVHFTLGDAQSIPFPDGTFEVVMARHMLYHVPDIERAVAELARVLRPGGRMLVTTNSARTMPEYRDLCDRAADRFPAMVQPDPITNRFSLENAPAILEPQVDGVETHVLRGTLRFPSAQPLLDYFTSHRSMTMCDGHTEGEWEAVLDYMRAEAESAVTRTGHFDVTKVTGAHVGVKGG